MNDTPKRTAVYMRCSTDLQTTEAQRHALQSWVEANAPDATWFADEGFSGADNNRPAWTDCYRRCMAGDFDRLVVWKKDRISRNMKRLLYWTYGLDQYGVELVSLTEEDSGNDLVDAIMQVIKAFHAEHERKLIAERTRAGIEASRAANGRKWGGGRVVNKATTRGVRRLSDAEEAEVAKLREEGVSWRKIAERFGVGTTSVRGAVKRHKERERHDDELRAKLEGAEKRIIDDYRQSVKENDNSVR